MELVAESRGLLPVSVGPWLCWLEFVVVETFGRGMKGRFIVIQYL